MAEYRHPTVEGRELLIRPAVGAARPQLQLALVSTLGNLMEAVTLEAGDVLGLVRGAARIARLAHDLHDQERRTRSVLAAERYAAALARNPWLTEDRKAREGRGLR